MEHDLDAPPAKRARFEPLEWEMSASVSDSESRPSSSSSVEADEDAAEQRARYKSALAENAALRRRLRGAQLKLKVSGRLGSQITAASL
jgi:hypothetical protein